MALGTQHELHRLEMCVDNSQDQNHASEGTPIEDGAGFLRKGLGKQNGMPALCLPAFQDAERHCVEELEKSPLASHSLLCSGEIAIQIRTHLVIQDVLGR